jgi:capsular exopolysaccharide synthesis family protein
MGRPRKVPLVEENEIEDFNESYQLCNLRNLYDHFFKTLWKLIIELDENKNDESEELITKKRKSNSRKTKKKKEKRINHTIVFSGFRRGDGASTMSLNFANAFAENSSNSVVLVDGNLRDPVLHNQFKLKKKKGLFDALQGKAGIQDITTEIIPKKLFFIPAGQQTKNPITLYESSKYGSLLKQLREKYDLVIFDSAPLLGNPETILLANKTDGLIMVLNAEVTRWEVARSVKDDLEGANVRILGAILNRKQFVIPQAIYKFI